jgi:hypothetical protein
VSLALADARIHCDPDHFVASAGMADMTAEERERWTAMLMLMAAGTQQDPAPKTRAEALKDKSTFRAVPLPDRRGALIIPPANP